MLNQRVKDTDYMSIPIWMHVVRVLILICKDHDVGMGANIDSILVSSTIICCKVDSHSPVAEDLIVVYDNLSAVMIGEVFTQSSSYSPE